MSISRGAVPRAGGIALIDLIMAIVIIGIAVAGVTAAISLSVRHSADPLVEKQALAIAEAMLEEVELMPFTNCTAGQRFDSPSNSCVAATTKTRGSTTDPFDNVLDYNGLTLTSNSADFSSMGLVAVPTGYSVSVAVAADAAFGQSGAYLPDTVRITVTVSYPGDSVVLEGYRTKYAPLAT